MLRMFASVADAARAESSGCVCSSCDRRAVGSGASVEMYRARLDRPWGGGSCVERRSVRRNWVLPTPLSEHEQVWRGLDKGASDCRRWKEGQHRTSRRSAL